MIKPKPKHQSNKTLINKPKPKLEDDDKACGLYNICGDTQGLQKRWILGG